MEEASIKIRLLVETHEVVLHPFYFTTLVKDCAKPRESSSKDALVELTYRKLFDIAKTYGVGWTRKAAEVLIQLAVELEFLQDRLHWNARAYVINAMTESKTQMDLPSQIMYLKYLLDGDGAILLNLAREMNELGELERSEFLNSGGWEKVIEHVCEIYLSIAVEPADKRRVRAIRDRARKGYAVHTREHRFNPRAATLVDLGIWSRENAGRIRYRAAHANGADMVDRFVSVFDSIPTLDSILSASGDFFRRAAELYQIECPKINVESDLNLLSGAIVRAYEACRDDSYRLAHMSAIRDIVCLTTLKDRNGVCEWQNVDQAIQKMREISEKDIRYHVDDWGRPTYLVISPRFVRESLEAPIPSR
jgi:hypothetical protein